MELPEIERELGSSFFWHPQRHGYRYDDRARNDLLRILFRALAGYNEKYLNEVLFPDGSPRDPIKLSEAQGGKEGAEYSEAARGKRCGHVFKTGEASYRCLTCSTDESCALCSRCFDASDHTGHKHSVFVSSGHSGCCDCGDEEAFRIPVNCAIHTDLGGSKGKEKAGPDIPADLMEAIRCTIARTMDYVCDVFSCSPEQLRLSKTEDGIRQDEVASRLCGEWYGNVEQADESPEFAVILWNDEKHSVNDVQNQVSRACREREQFGTDKAKEADDMGRTVVRYSNDLPHLLEISRKIEQIRITTTIRSSRDTYREQMCGTILNWFSDIASCHILDDNLVLRQTICDQMLRPWRTSGGASHAEIGRKGIDRHGLYDTVGNSRRTFVELNITAQLARHATHFANVRVDELDDDGGDDDNDEDNDEADVVNENEMVTVEPAQLTVDPSQLLADEITTDVGEGAAPEEDPDVEMRSDDDLEAGEATMAGYPSPPLPPQTAADGDGATTAAANESGTTARGTAANSSLRHVKIPKTPGVKTKTAPKPSSHWETKPSRYYERGRAPYENLRQRTRLDWLILFDLRLWKMARADLKELCLGTVVNVPEFKRVLGLRFAALYTALAQLYLIADREPDQSIINLSLQLITTPSITEDIVERGNFLTNLMAILYTFLTTRQVGGPHDVNPSATLALDSGAVTNRRLFHFYFDLRYLLPSEYVQSHIRTDSQYLLQFLDLVKLPQGICPSVRAVSEHVEFESESWFAALLVTKEINRLCRAFCDAFRPEKVKDQPIYLEKAIYAAGVSAMAHSVGLERKRFEHAEIKDLVHYKTVPYTDLEVESTGKPGRHRIVDFAIDRGGVSFHHPLHYTLSYLIEYGRNMPREKMRDILVNAARTCKLKLMNSQLDFAQPDDIILAMFDFPLRVCAWHAQIKAGLWVRNGLALRHQMHQYRAVAFRDFGYCRDILMLQAAFAICDPSRFLMTVADRFGVSEWMDRGFVTLPGYDDTQHVDVAEDFMNLLVVLVTQRGLLAPVDDEAAAERDIIRADIARALCFKPLSYSDLTDRISDKIADADCFQDVLAEVASFRPPDGLNDTGAFELKPEYIELIDPYTVQYSKNQRDEAENIYRQWMAKRTGKKASDVVFEPKLKPIPSGLFSQLSKFTQTPLFAYIVHRCLEYCLMYRVFTPHMAVTRVESLLHTILHLVLLAAKEDATTEDSSNRDPTLSFVSHCLSLSRTCQGGNVNVFYLLRMTLNTTAFEASAPAIRRILTIFSEKRPNGYNDATVKHPLPGDVAEPRPVGDGADNETDTKKKKALERQAKIMQQFQQQQQNFLDTQADIDWGEEELSQEEGKEGEPADTYAEKKKIWDYPSGNCILCQEECNNSRIYGTFVLLTEGKILRQTDLKDPGYVREALNTPSSLDRPAEDIRPFGVASENRETVRRLDSTGGEVISEKQGIGRGFPSHQAIRGPMAKGCGHIMHYSCFEVYRAGTVRRHQNQVARLQPERTKQNEFVCPLCKALGNAFLPIIWNSKEESYPGVLDPRDSFNDFLNETIVQSVSRMRGNSLIMSSDKLNTSGFQNLFLNYVSENIIPPLSSRIMQFAAPPTSEPFALPQSQRMPMPGVFPTSDDVPALSPLHQVSTPDDPPVSELVKIYGRIRETIHVNQISSNFAYQHTRIGAEDLVYTDTLMETFGFSISAVEIAQRGVGSEHGETLLHTIPESSLTDLRVLCETALSYASIGGLHNSSQKTVHEFREMQRRKQCQLFVGHPCITGLSRLAHENSAIEPLFSRDIFVFLAESSLALAPVLNIDILHVTRLCYIAEILKSIFAFILQSDGLINELNSNQSDQEMEGDSESQQIHTARRLFNWIVASYNSTAPYDLFANSDAPVGLLRDERPPNHILQSFHSIAAKYALPFLRKAVILLHVQHGVNFPSVGSDHADMSELDRLTALLRLPSVDEVLNSFGVGGEDNPLEALSSGWIAHWNLYSANTKSEENRVVAPSVSHPAIFELLGLPNFFDVFFDEASQRRCPSSGKELTDPSICLFCGEIFCAQADCCSGDRLEGGCHTHMTR